MKTYGKRVLYLLLALALTVSLLGTTAFAEGYTPTNGYVLEFGVQDSVVWKYAEFSRLAPYAYYGDQRIEGESIVFGLTCGNTVFESLYCTDLPTPASGTHYYRPLNLSDSTYAAAMANKLRGILLGTYPYITLEQLQANLGIDDLTLSEAITGSQMAIWKTAHGDIVTYSDAVHYVASANYRESDVQNKLNSEGVAFQEADEVGKAAVNERVWKLYNYLLGLTPVQPVKPVVSAASFVRKGAPTVTVEDGGTCSVTVETTVNVSVESGDSLTLTAYLGDGEYWTSEPLSNGTSSHTLTIEGVPANAAYDTVTLAIDGSQYLHDVYLIEARGGRGTSQSLVGALNHTLPVHAEVKAEPDRVLNIHKTAGGSPLQNISFEVYYVGSVDDYRAGELNIGSTPSDADVANYAKTTRLVGTITTDADGYGSLNFSTSDGVYLVRELPNNAVTAPVAPFFVSLPDWSCCDEKGDPAYTITAEPKNTLATESITIDKSVTAIGKDSDSFAVGEDHTWIIQSSIPKTIATGKAYTVTDTLDARLSYQRLDKVELASKTNTEETPLTLTENVHYTVTSGKTADGKQDTFTVSLTAAGMTKIGSEVGSNAANYELRIYFTAQINTSAAMGANIYNQAKVEYTNSVNRSFDATSVQPEVHTGGACLLKVDADTGAALSGATFAVYRMAGADEQENADATDIIIGQTSHKMIPVSFYNSSSMSGEKVTELTTDKDGKGYIYGLAYGDYYLVETRAPDGYNKLAEPTMFTIDAASHKEAEAIEVENTTGFALPETGGVGTRWFVLGGLALMLGACAVALGRKKERA